MADRTTAEEKLAALREMIISARSMPMSASCVINRNDVLAAIDDVIENLPDEIAEAQDVIDASKAKIAEGEDEAAQILADAREQAANLAQHTEVIRVAEAEGRQDPSRRRGGGGRPAPRDRHLHRLPDGQLRVRAAQDDQSGHAPPGSGWRSAASWTAAAPIRPLRVQTPEEAH